MDVSLHKGAQKFQEVFCGEDRSVTAPRIEAVILFCGGQEEVISEKLIMDLALEYSVLLQSI